MKEPVTALLSNQTITSIFLAALLIAITLFVTWARKLIDSQLKSKDDRIAKLESDFREMQKFQQNEMMDVIMETRIVMKKCLDAFNRLEGTIDKMNKN